MCVGNRVFVKVVGFTDAERHALNTVFRLSQEGHVSYSPWEADAPAAPRMLLVDGEDASAAAEVAIARQAGVPFTWIGPRAPGGAWQCFTRPLAWPDVVMALDEFFLPGPELDIDLDADPLDTRPTLVLGPGGRPCRALVVSAGLEERLYVRAKLSLALWTLADEAESPPRALELARTQDYELAVLDLAPWVDPWPLVEELRALQPALRGVLLLQPRPTLFQRLRASRAGVTLMRKPPHPGRLHDLLARLRFLPEKD